MQVNKQSKMRTGIGVVDTTPPLLNRPPEGEIRIKLASILGVVCTLISAFGLAWLTKVISFYPDDLLQTTPVTIKMQSDVPLSVHYSYYIDYGNPETRQQPKQGTLINVSIVNRNDPDNLSGLINQNTKFEFHSKYKILSYKVSTSQGDVTDKSQIKINTEAIGGIEYSVSPDPKTFIGNISLFITDIAPETSFSERKLSIFSHMYNLSEYGKLNHQLKNEFRVSLILPNDHDAVSYAPFSFRKTDDSIFTSDPEESLGHNSWGQALRMTFRNEQLSRLEQGLIIAFSTIFGAGISLIVEAFLAGGVILLHKNTLAEMRQNKYLIT
jgi:hypothetical protein